MATRRDPTVIGTDEFGNPVLRYFTCTQGYCREIYDLHCERRCDEQIFEVGKYNSIIFNGERVIMGYCDARSTAAQSRLEGRVSFLVYFSEFQK